MKQEKINFDERLIARGGRIWNVFPSLRLVLDCHDGLDRLYFQQPQPLGEGWEEASPRFVYWIMSNCDFNNFTVAFSALGDRALIVKKRSWRRNPQRSTRDYGYYFAVFDLTSGDAREISSRCAAALIKRGLYKVLGKEATPDETQN